MEKGYSETFRMKDGILCYSSDKSMLLCKEPNSSKNLWIKKIPDVTHIDNVIDDSSNYYIACETDDVRGYFLALNKKTGSTEWFIPGKAYFQIVYGDFLYAIFLDEKGLFYFLKIDRADGKKIWHRRIDDDLFEYSFLPERILLKYESGKTEKISPLTGANIN
jgi:outer membrane protein assembly factor BamB